MCVCVYIHIYIYTHTHIYIYIISLSLTLSTLLVSRRGTMFAIGPLTPPSRPSTEKTDQSGATQRFTQH